MQGQQTAATEAVSGLSEKKVAFLVRRIQMLPGAFPEGQRRIVALDGRCAAGKTTLAARLEQELDCAVFHMDDFFLRPEQRTPQRLNTPGGNVDYGRFRREILLPLRQGAGQITYRPYDCKTRTLMPPVTVRVPSVSIVEGAYSCHPALWELYDLRVFLSVPGEEQQRRLLRRNGEAGTAVFRERWIPLEEQYFSAYKIEERCDLRLASCEYGSSLPSHPPRK